MISLVSSRRLANEVLTDRLRWILRERKLSIAAIDALFSTQILLARLGTRWEHHQAFTFYDVWVGLFGPLVLVCVPFVAWLGNRLVTYPLCFRIDERGLTTPTGRPFDWFRPTKCEMIRDPHLPHIYHVRIIRRKKMMHDVLIDDPDQGAAFVAAFAKRFGSAH